MAPTEAAHSSMTADEMKERGFADGEELLLTYIESDSDDDRADADRLAELRKREKAEAQAAQKANATCGFPEQKIREIMFSDPKHSHADRRMADAWPDMHSSMLDLEDGPCAVPAERRLKHLAYEDLTDEQFEAWADTPFVIDNVAQAEGWPARYKWSSEEAFVADNADVMMPITELFPLHGFGKPQRVSLPLRHYVDYARTNEVDFPYYCWEREFAEERAVWLDKFWQPRHYRDDAYGLTDEARSWFPFCSHRFLIVGGPRTGAVLHQDPKASGGWNHILFGRKRWVFFPPSVSPADLWQTSGATEESSASEGGGASYKSMPATYWWADHYPRLRERAAELGMLEVLQCPGDTLHIPPGWWHAVLNLPSKEETLTLCVTQNSVTPAMLRASAWCRQTLFAYPFGPELTEMIRQKWPSLEGILPSTSTTDAEACAKVAPAQKNRAKVKSDEAHDDRSDPRRELTDAKDNGLLACRECQKSKPLADFSAKQVKAALDAAKIQVSQAHAYQGPLCIKCAEVQKQAEDVVPAPVAVCSLSGAPLTTSCNSTAATPARMYVTDRENLPAGLRYYPEFLTEAEEQRLMDVLDSQPWSTVLRRRQQFYGEVYYHTTRTMAAIQPSLESGGSSGSSACQEGYRQESPAEVKDGGVQPLDISALDWLVEKFYRAPFVSDSSEQASGQAVYPVFGTGKADFPTQVLVNEYIDNLGISSHFEDEAAFGDLIVTISLLNPLYMTLERPREKNNQCGEILQDLATAEPA
eukprot:TRINITY_DN44924_c0_g2_i2.p1 TRINITY_DN44924_c0_g2~~TRINITY_DN44924_c0_g2_i2.p1  ORF type:complete len:757 (-),score=102.71 TRINITY_DN44924_c0_g2_i2:184-2454(-)